MKSGLELDALVAKELFGLEIGWCRNLRNGFGFHFEGHDWQKEKFNDLPEEPYLKIQVPNKEKMGPFAQMMNPETLAQDYQSYFWVKPDENTLDSRRVEPYSSSIEHAWKVVEKMDSSLCKQDPSAAFTVIRTHPTGYWAGFTWHEIEYDGASAQTAPHAICLAALASIRGK